jgi:hypothetical protein
VGSVGLHKALNGSLQSGTAGCVEWSLAGGQGVAGSNPVVPTSIIAGRRPFPRVAGAALTVSGLGAMGSPLGALVLPTCRRVNGARFVRHPIR